MGLKYLPRNGEKELAEQDQQRLSKKEKRSRLENREQSATDQTQRFGAARSDATGRLDEGNLDDDDRGINEEEQIE